ncbi:MAG: BON domain-containing protein [Pseudomonadota bacterium]
MNKLNKSAAVVLGITGAMSLGTASAKIPDIGTQPLNSIIEVSNPDVHLTVRDGVATLSGNADSYSEALLAEEKISDIEGVDHVINLINWN